MMRLKRKTVHIREVAPGPTPERRIWHIYLGKEMQDWLSEDLSADIWKISLLRILKENDTVGSIIGLAAGAIADGADQT